MHDFSAPRRELALVIGLLSTAPALAQTPAVVRAALSPAPHTLAAPRPGALTIPFSHAIDPATAGNIRVFGGQRGQRLAPASVNGTTATLVPALAFLPGEAVQVTVPATVKSATGTPAKPYVYQFSAATNPTGSGVFGAVAAMAVGTAPGKVVLADVNADGFADLLVANNAPSPDNYVSVRLGDGSGAFGAAQTVAVPQPSDLVVADLDGDGDPDLLTCSTSADNVTLVYNTAGTFGGSVSLGASDPAALAVGDLNADGHLDIVASTVAARTAPTVWLNSGTGGAFTPLVNSGLGQVTAQQAKLGDLDNDGDLDLVLCIPGSVYTYFNTGTGTFTTGQTIVARGINGIDLADLDGNGNLDMVVGWPGGASPATLLYTYLNSGTGALTQGSAANVGYRPSGVQLADLDGDGDPDLLGITAGFFSVTPNNGLDPATGLLRFGSATAYPMGNGLPALADVNGDGALDVVAPGSTAPNVEVRLNRQVPTASALSPAFGPVGTTVTITGAGFTGVTAVNFNGTAASSFTVNSNTSITATVGAGTTTGPVTITGADGTGTGFVFTVANDLVVTTGTLASPVAIGNAVYRDVTISGSGVGQLVANATILGTLSVEGTLLTNCRVVVGTGNFELRAGATLGICEAAGLSTVANQGPVRLTGTRSYSPEAQYLYNGITAQVTGAALPAAVRGLTLNNSAGLTLSQNLTPATLSLITGILTTGPNTLTLDAPATLTETATAYVKGTVQTTRDLSAPVATEFGGLGLTLTPTAGSPLPGLTLVRRTTGTARTGVSGRQGILRSFDIQPAVNTGLDVTLTFGYRDAELNGISETSLALFKSETGAAGTWGRQAAATFDANANTATLTGVRDFSIWTLGSLSAPLPVELASFTAQAEGRATHLAWSTAAEKNSAYFAIERSRDGRAFEQIGQERGQGTKTSPTRYAFRDEHLPAGLTYYRLRQVDVDGTASYSAVRTVALAAAAPEAALVVYPTKAVPGQPLRYAYTGPALPAAATLEAVSYTHLTLPTIYSV